MVLSAKGRAAAAKVKARQAARQAAKTKARKSTISKKEAARKRVLERQAAGQLKKDIARGKKPLKKLKPISRTTITRTPVRTTPKKPVGELRGTKTRIETFTNKDLRTPIKTLTKIGLTKIEERLAKSKETQLEKIRKSKPTAVVGRTLRGTAVLGALGAARGGIGVIRAVTNPVKFIKSQVQALSTPRETLKLAGQEFTVDPVGTVAEYAAFAKGLKVAGKTVKKSPLGRVVSEEIFIRKQPKNLQKFVRKIIKSAKVQETLNPTKIKSISSKNIKLLKPKSMNSLEFKAITKALRTSNSIVFGSGVERVLSKGKTKLPKDIDLATSNPLRFSKQFIDAIPKAQRKNYVLKGEKVLKNGKTLFDVKPLNRLTPGKNFLTGKGELPATSLEKVLVTKKGSILPELKRRLVSGKFTVQTQKRVKVAGIKLVGFGEQTTRKALGTLQVLLEKNTRRAKDPAAFIKNLELQVQGLKKTSKNAKTLLGKARAKARAKKLQDALKVLKSKEFAKVLEKRIGKVAKEFPIFKKISVKKLRGVAKVKPKPKSIAKPPVRKVKPLKPTIKKLVKRKVKPKTKPKSKTSKIPKKKPSSKLPSKLPKKKPVSKLPSKLPSRKPSKLPSRLPSRIPSKLPSKLPISKLPSSILPIKPPGKVPSRLPPSKLPSRLPSKLPASKLPSKLPAKTKKIMLFLKKPSIVKVKSSQPGYFVQMKIKGKFVNIASNVVSRTNARKLAEFLADNTVKASYKIKKANKKVDTSFKNLADVKAKFRKSKNKKLKGVFVERRGRRIDTIGEIQGLKLSRLVNSIGLSRGKLKSVKKPKRRKVVSKSKKVNAPKLKQFKIKELKL